VAKGSVEPVWREAFKMRHRSFGGTVNSALLAAKRTFRSANPVMKWSAFGLLVLGGTGCRPAETDRKVAFDNVYNAATVWVYARVDGGAERQTTAVCDPTTCTFNLKLLPGTHRLDIAVRGENDRQRSTESSMSVTVP
jgi:hypothetical protein